MNGPYEVHAFVCLGGKSCPSAGSEEVWRALREAVEARGLKQRVRVNKAGCMSQCGHGPMICVYPQNVWYGGVGLADVEAIATHLEGGPPVAQRIYRPKEPGANKTGTE